MSSVAKMAGLLHKWDPNVCCYQYGEAWKFRSEEEMFDYVEHARHMFFGPTLTPPKPWGACTISLRPGGIVTVNAPTSWTPLSSMVSAGKNSRSVYMRRLVRHHGGAQDAASLRGVPRSAAAAPVHLFAGPASQETI